MALVDRDAREVFVSVDIEASGQSPSTGSMLSIGACLVDDPSAGLYLELKPLPDRPWREEAAAVHSLDRSTLEREGLTPEDAMARFEAWLKEACGQPSQPVFVGFNAPFDWMFVADYFWRYLGRNPFGISALDLKSYYMGRTHVGRWEETRKAYVYRQLRLENENTHRALEDARGQARMARLLLGVEQGSEI